MRHLDYLLRLPRRSKAFKILINSGRLHLYIHFHNICRSASIDSSQPTMAPSYNSRRASLSTSSTPLSQYGSLDENCKIEKLVNIPSKVSKYFCVCCKILRWYIIKWGNSGTKSISSASLTLFHITNIFYSCHTVCGR